MKANAKTRPNESKIQSKSFSQNKSQSKGKTRAEAKGKTRTEAKGKVSQNHSLVQTKIPAMIMVGISYIINIVSLYNDAYSAAFVVSSAAASADASAAGAASAATSTFAFSSTTLTGISTITSLWKLTVAT